MRPRHDLKASIRLLAIAVLGNAVVAAVIRVRRSQERVMARQAPHAETSLAAQLARCRSITPVQLAVDHSCERVWAENRRQFFASGESASAVSRRSAVPRASPPPQHIPVSVSSAQHAAAADVAPPSNVRSSSAPSRKAPPQPTERPFAISRPDPAAAPGEK